MLVDSECVPPRELFAVIVNVVFNGIYVIGAIDNTPLDAPMLTPILGGLTDQVVSMDGTNVEI